MTDFSPTSGEWLTTLTPIYQSFLDGGRDGDYIILSNPHSDDEFIQYKRRSANINVQGSPCCWG